MKHIIVTLRHISIKRRLKYLFMIQMIVVILLFLLAAYSSFNRMEHQARLSGQQLLHTAASQMSDACSEITVLTRYPAIASGYGDTQIYSYLSQDIDGHRGTDHMALQYEMNNQIMLHPSVSLLGIADLNGNLLYCDADNNYYKLTRYDADSPLYGSIIGLCGGFRLISTSEMDALAPGIHTDADCLYGARAIMKLYHLETVGMIFCRIDTADVRASFEMNRLYPEQTLSLWNSKGQLLYGDGSGFDSAPPAGEDGVAAQWRGESLYQIYQSGDGVTAVLRTPLRCFLRSMGLYLAALFMLLPVLVIIVLVFSRMLVRSIREPIDKLMGVCGRVQARDFSPLADEGACDEMHSLIESFNTMCADIRNLIEVVYEKELLQAQTETQLVRSQINPHFVYNTLEVIRAASYSRGQTDIADMTALLGKTLRYGITHQADSVTVEQEMFHLQDYIALQQMHLQHRMEVYINVDSQMYACYMLRLVLQPLVENAIHHGQPRDGRRSVIRILGFLEGEDMVFTVSDDGAGIPQDHLARLRDYIQGRNDAFSSIGLRNTHRRLILHYGDRYGLEIRSVPDQGTVVTVRMPRRTAPFTEDDKETQA